MSEPTPRQPGSCLNCGASLGGAFCAQCGQRDLDPEIRLRDLADEAVEAFASIDSIAVRSFLGLVSRPGRLTLDYLNGRRARYLPPLRLYLLCSLAFVVARGLSNWITGPERDTSFKVTTTTREAGGGKRVVEGDAAVRILLDSASAEANALGDGVAGRVIRSVLTDQAGFRKRVQRTAPYAFFVLVPTCAALLALAFRTRRWSYPRHLVVALHLHAAGFLFFAAAQLVSVSARLAAAGDALAFGGMAVFTSLALATVYGTSRRRAVFNAVLVAAPYAVVVGVAIVAVIGIAALTT